VTFGTASATGLVRAPAASVYRIIADYRIEKSWRGSMHMPVPVRAPSELEALTSVMDAI
jgi:hypothetical protein